MGGVRVLVGTGKGAFVLPSLTDQETVYAGVEDAALFRSMDGAQTWHELQVEGPAT